MPAWKDALLQVAREKFAKQQADQLAQGNTAKLMAPISPSPTALIHRSLELIVAHRPHLSNCMRAGGNEVSASVESGADAPASAASATATMPLVVDLGCGDGRWLIVAAERFGWHGVGYDLNDELLARGREAANAARVNECVTFVRDDLLRADVTAADVVVA
jgi:SAM-dependent methyltransferase